MTARSGSIFFWGDVSGNTRSGIQVAEALDVGVVAAITAAIAEVKK